MKAGAWTSPITADMVAGASVRYGGLAVLPLADGPLLVWTEGRPDEAGRSQIVAKSLDGEAFDWSDPERSARSRVHEYGGGEFCVWAGADGTSYLVFVDAETQDLFLQTEAGAPAKRLTKLPGLRFGAMNPQHAVYGPDNTLAVVVEDHRDESEPPANFLALVHLPEADLNEPITDPVALSVIDAQRDFYASPRFWPRDGMSERLVWLGWDLPHMPWERAALWAAELVETGGEVGLKVNSAEHLYGGSDAAVFQPEIGPDGALYFVSDATGFGQLHRMQAKSGQVQQITSDEVELMRPQWALGMTSYAILDDGRAIITGYERGHLRAEIVSLSGDDAPETIESFGHLADISGVVSSGGHGLIEARLSDRPPAIKRFDVNGPEAFDLIDVAGQVDDVPALRATGVSVGEAVEFPGDEGAHVYGVLYRPVNHGIASVPGELPPAIVRVHGGPTGMASRGFDWKTQYWTSRGFVVFDVDYSGSAGYGRAYRARLDGQWGLRDTRDCIAAAEWLAAEKLADPGKRSIMGGSSGGYTVLMALAMSDVFAAGSSYYGISDLGELLAHTHKFESGYIHGLLGTTPDDWEATLAARSPINMLDKISSPVIFFQGMKDRVCPPEQSQAIYDALVARGVSSEMVTYPNEGHGFRDGQTIVNSLQRNLEWLQGVLKLVPGDT